MKKIVVLVVCLVMVFGVGALALNPVFADSLKNSISFSACDTPQTVSIGSIDARFGITKEEVESSVRKATQEWSDAYGKQLFVLTSGGELTVNLTYDERQYLTSQISGMHEKLEDKKNSIDPKIAEYESRVKSFKQRVSELNAKIAYWNSRGGAPEGEFETLYNEQQALKNEAAELERLAGQLNQSTNDYNDQVSQLNQTIDTFNDAIEERPEEGLFNGKDKTITIFFMADESELQHTLTHEFGHALGIDHLNNPQAMMYYQTNDQLSLTEDDISALMYACRKQTIFEIAGERIAYGIYALRSSLSTLSVQK